MCLFLTSFHRSFPIAKVNPQAAYLGITAAIEELMNKLKKNVK